MVALKVDVNKAYDRVSAAFLKAALVEIGFPLNLLTLITECVTMMSYSSLLSGEPSRSVLLGKGYTRGNHYHLIFSCYVWRTCPG